MRPLRGLQETRVATREESGVLGFPSRRGLTPRPQKGRLAALHDEPSEARTPPPPSHPWWAPCSGNAPQKPGQGGFGSEGAQTQASVGRSLCRHLRRGTPGLQTPPGRRIAFVAGPCLPVPIGGCGKEAQVARQGVAGVGKRWIGQKASALVLTLAVQEHWSGLPFSHFQRHLGSFFQNSTYSYHTIQQRHSLVFIQRSGKYMSTQKTYTWVFIAALFIIAKIQKQPRCPSIGEWINCGTSRQWNIIQC